MYFQDFNFFALENMFQIIVAQCQRFPYLLRHRFPTRRRLGIKYLESDYIDNPFACMGLAALMFPMNISVCQLIAFEEQDRMSSPITSRLFKKES